jgi:hypothetical protein
VIEPSSWMVKPSISQIGQWSPSITITSTDGEC